MYGYGNTQVYDIKFAPKSRKLLLKERNIVILMYSLQWIVLANITKYIHS